MDPSRVANYLAPPMRCQSVAGAPKAAREYVRQVLTTRGSVDLVDAAELAVSELVTNACLHARSALVIAVRQVGGAVRIEVHDESPVLPSARRHSPLSTTGRGMHLLDSLGHWGAEPDLSGGGKVVWFQTG